MVLAWLQKCTADYLKLSEVSTIRTFSSRKWTGRCLCSELCAVKEWITANKSLCAAPHTERGIELWLVLVLGWGGEAVKHK